MVATFELIINRAAAHNLAPTGELMRLLIDPYPIDTIQAQLQTNNFYFKGLSLEDCARLLGVETRTCHGAEIKTRYEEEDYTAITEHVTEDVEITEKLFNAIKDMSLEAGPN